MVTLADTLEGRAAVLAYHLAAPRIRTIRITEQRATKPWYRHLIAFDARHRHPGAIHVEPLPPGWVQRTLSAARRFNESVRPCRMPWEKEAA